jgi:hypothetical protein
MRTTDAENPRVLDEIISSLGRDTWCVHEPYVLNDIERYQHGWGTFCKAGKHQTRYFFGDFSERDIGDERIPVGGMLDELRDVFSEAGLIKLLAANTKIHRGRLHEASLRCRTREALGPPPERSAPSNRMSAAGIPMFYSSFDVTTIKAEVMANIEPESSDVLTVATWINPKPLQILILQGFQSCQASTAVRNPYETGFSS